MYKVPGSHCSSVPVQCNLRTSKISLPRHFSTIVTSFIFYSLLFLSTYNGLSSPCPFPSFPSPPPSSSEIQTQRIPSDFHNFPPRHPRYTAIYLHSCMHGCDMWCGLEYEWVCSADSVLMLCACPLLYPLSTPYLICMTHSLLPLQHVLYLHLSFATPSRHSRSFLVDSTPYC